MSIAEEIESIENHIENAYQGLINLGVDLTNTDKNIDNIKACLDSVYNEYPKTPTQTGTSITLENTKKGRINIDLKGNTSQESTTGKNLCPNTVTTDSYQGINYNINSDGSVTTNGTSTAVSFVNVIKDSILTLPAGTYILSGCPNDGSDSSYRIDINNGEQIKEYGTGTTFTLNEETTLRNVRLRIASGVTVNNLIFKPMIRLSSVVDDTFEPYTGGIPSPNPDYPQDIKVVKGNNTITIDDGTNSENYSVNLGTLELCKIGDYQDYIYKNNGKWYKKGIIKKVILDGTENWITQSSSVYRLDVNDYLREANINICVLNHFATVVNGGYGDLPDNTARFRYNNNDTNKHLYIHKSTSESVNDFISWLSSNNETIYYILNSNNYTDIEITDTTLINQLEAIYNAQSVDNTTIISQTNTELPFILTANALKKI